MARDPEDRPAPALETPTEPSCCYSGDGFLGGFELHYAGSVATAMPYEPGSSQCRVLIDCKAQVETMLLTLTRIEESEPIRQQLLQVHQQLEALHDRHRSQPTFTPQETQLRCA